MSGSGAAVSIRGAVGLIPPRQVHVPGALLRRALFLVIIALGALLAPAGALADGRDILNDFEDNGQIDECYTPAEFDEAFGLVRDDERQYGALVEVLSDARITNVEKPGEACGANQIGSDIVDVDDGGSSLGLWIGLAGVVLVVAIGAGIWARRGGASDG